MDIKSELIRKVIPKVLDSGLEVSEFKLQLRYYIHFRTNNLEKGMESLYLFSSGLMLSLLFFYSDDFGIK